jgi:protein SCO1
MTRRARWIIGGAGWALVAVLGVTLALRGRGRGGGAEDELPPRLMPIAAFELVDQDGRAFGSAQLAGRPWVAGLAFTSCTSVCPMLTSQMANVQRRLASEGARVRLVTLTVDPEVDTPERLREYATRYEADLSSWSFLTGEPARVRQTIEQSFRRPIGARQELPGGYDILHSGDLMLVDGQGVLRGLYRTDAEGLDALVRDAARVAVE